MRGYYWDELKLHFKGRNNMHRYAIIRGKHTCKIYDGDRVAIKVP